MTRTTGVRKALFALMIVLVATLLVALPATAETDNKSALEFLAAQEMGETATEGMVMVSEADILEAVTVMLTTLKDVNKTDWKLMLPDSGMWLFPGAYDFCWDYPDGYGIPLKTIAIWPKNGTLDDIIFLTVRQAGFFDGSCSVEIELPPDAEREEYLAVIALDYPGVQGTYLQIRMYCDILIFNEAPTTARDLPWLMPPFPQLALTSGENEEQPMPARSLPIRPRPTPPPIKTLP